jgi:hypothetical protein
MTSIRRLHLECRWFTGNRHSANDLLAFLAAGICKLAAHELCASYGCCTACAREAECCVWEEKCVADMLCLVCCGELDHVRFSCPH